MNDVAKDTLLLSIPQTCLISVELAKAESELCRRLLMEEIEVGEDLDLSGTTHLLTHASLHPLIYPSHSTATKFFGIVHTRDSV